VKKILDAHRRVVENALLLVLFSAVLLVLTGLTAGGNTVANTETVAFSFLLVVLFSAFFGNLFVSVVVSLVATLCFDYFYLPPFGTLNVNSFPDWISLFSFLIVAVLISHLTASATRTKTANNRLEATMNQLNTLGHWLISKKNDELSLTLIAQEITRVFSFPYCSIHVYSLGKWDHHLGAAATELSDQVELAIQQVDQPLGWTDLLVETDLGVRYVSIQKGTETFAVMAVKDSVTTTESLKALAYLIGIRLSTT